MSEKLQKIVDVLPVIYQISDERTYITVIDKNEIVVGYKIPAGQETVMPVGSKFVDPSGAFNEVLRTGKKKINQLPKEVMGAAFEGVLIPVIDDGIVEGVMIFSHCVEETEMLRDMANEFTNSVTAIHESIVGILEGFDEINGVLKGVDEKATEVDTSVKAAKDVVNTIQANAKHSNILALNASIEAARSGEAGRGFAVVATEMGKLSNASGSSATEIDSALANIARQMEDIAKVINKINEMADGYSEDIEKTKNILEKTLEVADSLKTRL